ncbi:MAG: recombination protein RecR [Gammaproteobacteria bacterium]|nr:recombination protein RecR [Gammaproteobacteria bacterium]|tara:strand:- start:701 stop:1321 length:621 start_codon:yes stop_codon:yes gene_type:complete
MKESRKLIELIEALTILPGIGKKSAQRMAYQLIRSDKKMVLNLSKKLEDITTQISNCKICGIYLDLNDVLEQTNDECLSCVRENRDKSKICVTESPSDVYVINNSTDYNGYYFVLEGNLSPIDGRGPREIGIEKLEKRLKSNCVSELILATNTTVEGEATAHYIHQMAINLNIKISRIAFGIPLNGELGYLDSETISHAFNERKTI